MAAKRSNMLFDCLDNILVEKSKTKYAEHIESPDFKDFTRYMCQRYLTMSPSQAVRKIILDNYASLEKMDDRTFYLWALRAVPKQRNGFIRYLR